MAVQVVSSERSPGVVRPNLYVIDLERHMQPAGDARFHARRRRRLARRARQAAEAAIWLAGSAALCILLLEGAAGLFR
jgi:hypothetical protein